MEIPLRLGPLKAEGYQVHRSGVRWLCEPGQMCRANQVVAYFNLSLEPDGARPGNPPPFDEDRQLQVACAVRADGRLFYDADATPGGYLSILSFTAWDPNLVLARLEVDGSSSDLGDDAGHLRLLMLSARRMTALVDVHAGLLPGWSGRSRAWWAEEGETPVTLLSLGLCDLTGVVLGEEGAFVELFQAETAPSQFIFVPDHPITPSAPVLLDQIQRTPAQFHAIAVDLRTSLSRGPMPVADDWIFAGTMLSMMQRNPIRETSDLVLPAGFKRNGPPDAVLLSLLAEPPSVLRHKTLGYRLHVLRHHMTATGPAIQHWLTNSFEAVPRTTDDIRADLEKLIDAIHKSTGARVIIFNRMSTSGDENISSYAPFDAPMSATLANIASKELNLMLHDVAEGRNVSIIDVDAIAADIGGGDHLPDGAHQSRALQEILRGEILDVLNELRAARVPGVAA
jgi:hypothetical protein